MGMVVVFTGNKLPVVSYTWIETKKEAMQPCIFFYWARTGYDMYRRNCKRNGDRFFFHSIGQGAEKVAIRPLRLPSLFSTPHSHPLSPFCAYFS